MAELNFQIPSKVLFGSDVINLLGSLVSEYGNRTFLVADVNLHEGRFIEKIQDTLKKKSIDCIVADDLVGGNSRRTVSDVVEFAKASRTQVILGMGGLKTLFTARQVACTAALPARNGKSEPLPYIEIPTVFRNPFLLTDNYLDVDRSTGRPKIVRAPSGLVKAAVLDPSTTATLTTKYTGTLLMDLILNTLEGYLSTGSNFLSDALFLSSLKLLGEAVEDAVRGAKDLRHRVKASQAGLLTAVALTTSHTGAGVALSYAVNALFRTPKSWVSTALLPHIIDIHFGARAEKLSDVAKSLGEDVYGLSSSDAAQQASNRVRRIIGQLGLPARLREFDLRLPELADAAEVASGFDMMSHMPISMTVDSLYDLLKRAF